MPDGINCQDVIECSVNTAVETMMSHKKEVRWHISCRRSVKQDILDVCIRRNLKKNLSTAPQERS